MTAIVIVMSIVFIYQLIKTCRRKDDQLVGVILGLGGMNSDRVTEDDIITADKLIRKSLPRTKFRHLQFSHAWGSVQKSAAVST